MGLVAASALTGALFNLNPAQFLGFGVGASGWGKSGDPHSKRVTFEELMKGSQVGSGISISNAIQANLKANGMMALGTVLGATAINAVAKKVGVYRTMNKVVRSVGLGKLVKFS